LKQKYFRNLSAFKRQAFIIVLVLVMIVPQTVASATDVAELKRREEQTNLRIKLLQEEVSQSKGELSDVDTKVSSVEDTIATIEKDLKTNEARITELTRSLVERERAIEEIKSDLAYTMRDLALSEETSAVATFFNNDNFADAVREIEQKQMLSEKIGQHYGSIVEHTESLAAARDQMEMAKLALASSRMSLDLQRETLRVQQSQQRQLVSLSQGSLQAAQAERSAIRSQLFAVAFDNTGKTINFDQAAIYARTAVDRIEKSTGKKLQVQVVLALMRHESNFGAYVGKGNYRAAMCDQGQRDAFLQITKSLNLDPEVTPVSQPAKAQSCGGAMGYAQFLPKTWLGYAQKVGELTGHRPPSPWNSEDAFTAVALKLVANGAADGSTAEQVRRSQWEALMTYFSGSRWKDPAILPNIRWYADNILRTADGYAIIL
jgi:membrane-bound lytic murein transglycosylase B